MLCSLVVETSSPDNPTFTPDTPYFSLSIYNNAEFEVDVFGKGVTWIGNPIKVATIPFGECSFQEICSVPRLVTLFLYQYQKVEMFHQYIRLD